MPLKSNWLGRRKKPMNCVNLGVVKVAVFLPLRGRVHLDWAKAEYEAVRNG
jgi:hypothetical protein